MNSVINRFGVITDDWQPFNRQAVANATNRVLVTSHDLARYPRYFTHCRFELGLDLAADEVVQDISDWLGKLALVRLNFTCFADGRAFSQAHMLRQRYAFKGDIRAHGEVLRDQLSFMYRCGFNQFSLARGEDPELALASFEDIGVSYQPQPREEKLDSVVNA